MEKAELELLLAVIHKECVITTSRSSGSGGQHVNKVETKVTLKWNIEDSDYLEDNQKEKLINMYSNQINQDGDWVLQTQEERSQHGNKIKIFKKLDSLIAKGLEEKKKRKKTKPTAASNENRIKDKKKRSDVKSKRRSYDYDDDY